MSPFNDAVVGATPGDDYVRDDQVPGILPFYIVCDESKSMEGSRLDMVNKMLPQLWSDLRRSPALSDRVRVSIISFSEDAQDLVELADLAEVEQIPGLSPRTCTNYGVAFSHLHQTIERDVETLKASGQKVHRPVVFFLTDGAPNDPGWEAHYDALVDQAFPYHPNVISFGIGEADAGVIEKVATLQAYMTANGASTEEAISAWAKVLLQTMVSTGSGRLTAAEPGTGLTSMLMTTV